VIDADAVFASNTSTLPISGLAEASARPGNFIGMHFFSPVERMPLVEIIRGRKTEDVDPRPGARPRQAPRQDADRRERQPRLLHEPRLRDLLLRRPGAAVGRRERRR
jgi:hypothetical protein